MFLKGNESNSKEMKDLTFIPKERDNGSAEEYLGFNRSQLSINGGTHTAMEICQQPQVWKNTWELMLDHQQELKAYLDEVYIHKDLEIILTGAGTSAFIGDILEGTFQKNSKKRTKALATTDLVSHPQQNFTAESPTLLISFARSGNSPESLAAIQLANKFCKKVYHLIITCNPAGKLVTELSSSSKFIFLLPKEADDQSLAMTSSFTSMLLAGILISRIHEINDLKPQIDLLIGYGNHILKNYTSSLARVSTMNFDRAVFLGSGPLKGTARESQLKLQELTDGKVICKYDSFLGFRHGPKAIINPSTLLIFLFSNNQYAHQYETDLVKDINAGEKGLFRIGIFESAKTDPDLDLCIELSDRPTKIEEEFLSICSVLPAQILGFFKSLNLGLHPDSPSVNGTITRVVQGVTIYPHLLKPENEEMK